MQGYAPFAFLCGFPRPYRYIRVRLSTGNHTRYRQRMARIENGMPVVREEHPGGEKKPMFGPPFRDHLRQGGEFRIERCRRRGETRHVVRNQGSDSTRRRSRDMRVNITLGSDPTI